MKGDIENYWRFNGIETPSMKARTKVLASFEAGKTFNGVDFSLMRARTKDESKDEGASEL